MPHGRDIAGLIQVLMFFGPVVLSLCWTTWKERQVLKRTLHRDVRPGEDLSFETWMRVPANDLDALNQQLNASPMTAAARMGAQQAPVDPPPIPRPNPQDYGPELAVIRHRRQLSWFLFLTFLPGLAAWSVLTREGVASSQMSPFVVYGWLAAVVAAVTRVRMSRCPRCGNLFYTGVGLKSMDFWTRNCLTCDLYIDAAKTPPEMR